jgi:rhomboid family GlyGly-CTERM serine protease
MITAGLDKSSLAAWRFPAGLAAIIVLTQAAGPMVHGALAYDRAAIASGEVWRMFTANFVHLSWYHCFLNVLALVAYALLCPGRVTALAWTARVAALSLGVSMGLYAFAPRVDTYVGLSGALHGLFVLGLWPLAARRDLIAIGCLVFLVSKIAWELAMGAPVSDAASIGGRVVTESHLFGTLAALVYGLIVNGLGQSGET